MTRLEVGNVFDHVTADELRELMRKYFLSYGKGVKYRRIIESYPVVNNEILTTGMSPPDGYSWLIKFTQSDFSGATTPGNLQWFESSKQDVNLLVSAANNQNPIADAGAAVLADAVLLLDARLSSGSTVVPNQGTGGSALNGATTGLGTTYGSDLYFLNWTGENYIWTAPDAANIIRPVTGVSYSNTEFDMRAEFTSTSWHADSLGDTFLYGYGGIWEWGLKADGNMYVALENLAFVQHVYNFGANLNLVNGTRGWVKATGSWVAGSWTLKGYDSPDGITWTQVGTTQTFVDTQIYVALTSVAAGWGPEGARPKKLHQFSYRQTINGTVDIAVNTNVVTGSTVTFTATTGQAMTIDRATSGFTVACVDRNVWVSRSPGKITVPNNALLNFNASQDMTMIIVRRQWNAPAANQAYMDKWNNTSGAIGYLLGTYSTPTGEFAELADGTITIDRTPYPAITVGALSVQALSVNRTSQLEQLSTNGISLAAPNSVATLGSMSNITDLTIGQTAPGEIIAAILFRRVVTLAELVSVYNYYLNGPVGATAVPATTDINFLLHPGEKIVPVLQGAVQGSRTTIIVALGVIEVPWEMEPKLLGGTA